MSKKIQKYLKGSWSCKDCNTVIEKMVIVTVVKNFSIEQLTAAVLAHPEGLQNCPKCNAQQFEIDYSFYHKEKLTK
jgi:Zn finger protein HypA/HybF involved in hydrogenase expression